MEHIKWLYEVIDNAHAQKMNQDIIQAIEYIIRGAKAKLPMEKEQLENSYFNGGADNMNDEGSFVEYYNETYGGDK